MATRPVETLAEQLDRVGLMAEGDPQWDLSDNDIAALKAVLADRARLQGLLDQIATFTSDTTLTNAESFTAIEKLLRSESSR